jgi:hypothetical protein
MSAVVIAFPPRLMPCPVCGGRARIFVDGCRPMVQCRGACIYDGPRIYRDTPAQAARSWNTFARQAAAV